MQRRMHRSVILLAAAVTTLTTALAGCSNNPGGQGGDQTLTMFTSSDLKDAYEPVFRAFEAANPGVRINVTYGTGNEFESTQITQLASGSGPDLLDVLPGSGGNLISVGSLAAKNYLADLSGSDWAGQIPDSLRSQTDVDGKTFAFPGLLQPLGAFYNTQAVQKAGLKVPTTWTELLNFCKGAHADGEVAFSLGLSDQWVGQLVPYALASTIVYGPDPDWNAKLTSGAATFPDSGWNQVLGKYLELDKAGCFSADPNGISFDNTLPPVAEGKALAVVQVGGVFGQMQELNKDVTYELQPLPATDDASATYMAASPGHGVGVNAASDRKDLAVKFVNFMAEPKNINAIAEVLGGGVPAVPNDEFKPAALLDTFNTFVADGRVSAFPDTGWPSAEIQNAHLVGIQNMFLGKKTPGDVLTEMQKAVS